MAESKRVIRPIISALIIGATALGLYNVFSDNSDVVSLAESVACGKENCSVQMTRQERNPFAQSFAFQTSLKNESTVEVRCVRSLYLLGEYDCRKK